LRITDTSRSGVTSDRRTSADTPASAAVTTAASSSEPAISTVRGTLPRRTARSTRSTSSSTRSATTTATSAWSSSAASTTWTSGRGRSWLATPAWEIGSSA
jgi:hypothetical protein